MTPSLSGGQWLCKSKVLVLNTAYSILALKPVWPMHHPYWRLFQLRSPPAYFSESPSPAYYFHDPDFFILLGGTPSPYVVFLLRTPPHTFFQFQFDLKLNNPEVHACIAYDTFFLFADNVTSARINVDHSYSTFNITSCYKCCCIFVYRTNSISSHLCEYYNESHIYLRRLP